MTVHPDRVYRLGIAIRTMRWPEEATRLEIDFVSILRPSILELKGIHFEKTPAFEETVLHIRGNLSPLDRGHDITLRAAYLLKDGSFLPVRVVGHPKLRLKTFDAATALPRALPMVASKLQDMIGVAETKLPGLPAADREDLFVLLESLLRFADRAMQEKVLSGGDRLAEAGFQQELKRHFYADPNIGARLQEKASQAGGITDLGLGRVVLELKVEHDKPVSMADTHKYMSQAAHYGSSKDCPVSLLCILDDSKKDGPPGIPANYVDWLSPALHGLTDPRYPSLVAAVIVPIRFPPPSTWSQ